MLHALDTPHGIECIVVVVVVVVSSQYNKYSYLLQYSEIDYD